jgi:hypothetical protein
MKTNKRAVCAAILLALATSFTACVVEPDPPLKITVTGLDESNNGKLAFVMIEYSLGDTAASVSGRIANGSVGGNLRKDDGTDWTSTGDYYVVLLIYPEEENKADKKYVSLAKKSIQSETTIAFSELEEGTLPQ